MSGLFIVWSREYETGIPILDEQHRGLVSLINSFFFHRGDKDGDINRVLVPTAEMFKSYAKINFLTVEKLMRDSGYPELDKYRRTHERILADIEVSDRKFRARRDAAGLLQYLKEYWLEEVRGCEREYLDHLLRHLDAQEARQAGGA